MVLTRALLLLSAVLLSSTCWAGYYDVLDNGEILPKGTYKLLGDAQLLTDSGGLNVSAAFDTGIDEEFGARGLVGFGRTDYFFGGLLKWMPIPDIEGGQPAVGFNLGLLYGHWNDDSDLTIRWEPLVSKKFKIETAVVTPYASIPVGVRIRNSNSNYNTSGTDVTWQLAVGSQLRVERWKNLQFMGEVGMDLGNALSYISLAAVWYFDFEHGFELK